MEKFFDLMVDYFIAGILYLIWWKVADGHGTLHLPQQLGR